MVSPSKRRRPRIRRPGPSSPARYGSRKPTCAGSRRRCRAGWRGPGPGPAVYPSSDTAMLCERAAWARTNASDALMPRPPRPVVSSMATDGSDLHQDPRTSLSGDGRSRARASAGYAARPGIPRVPAARRRAFHRGIGGCSSCRDLRPDRGGTQQHLHHGRSRGAPTAGASRGEAAGDEGGDCGHVSLGPLASLCTVLWEVRVGRRSRLPDWLATTDPAVLSSSLVERILVRLEEFAKRWRSLPVGGSITLVWERALTAAR
jgi:hypothetical protein